MKPFNGEHEVTRTLTDGPTRFGCFIAPFHRVGVSPTVLFERDLELIERADKLGFQEAWVGEHHSGGHEPIGCPELFLAAAAMRTQTIKLGTAVSSLPYHNPFTLASRLTQLDHLSHGRAMMGFGPGQLASDAHMFGIEVSRQREMMLEAAEVIVRLMHGEVVTAKTDWFELRDAQLQVRPYQVPTMDMVVAAVSSPSGPRTAGRLGIGMINLAATSPPAFAALLEHWATCEHEAQKAGVEVHRENWRLSAMMHLAETEEQARADCEYGFEEIWRYLGQVTPLAVPDDMPWEQLLDEAIDSGAIVVGTPDTAIEMISKLSAQTGGYGSFIKTVADFANFDARMKSIELFAEYVIPEFRGQLDTIRRSHKWVLGNKADEGTIWKTQTTHAIAKATQQYAEERRTALDSTTVSSD
jgi:limonene 1,2-monooxygenase